MRIANWHGGEIFKGFIDQAEANANVVMDEIVVAAKSNLKMKNPQVYRADGWEKAHVVFIPKRGRHKDQVVDFDTDKRWKGRGNPNTLGGSIRRVNRKGSGGIRVYCGNFKVYWAYMVEKSGYTDRKGNFHPPLHFLSKTFNAAKKDMVSKVAKG
jgi:hypothetical protein